MNAYEEMSKSELEAELVKLKDQLEEVLDERSLIIGPQNGHVSSKYIAKHAVKYAKEIEELNANIALAEKLLKSNT
jgi:hypothetical protein